MTFHLGPDKLAPSRRRRWSPTAPRSPSAGLSARLPMALVRELVRPGRRGLPVLGRRSIDVDLLVAAGALAVCEESYVGFEQDLGLWRHAFRRAVRKAPSRSARAAA